MLQRSDKMKDKTKRIIVWVLLFLMFFTSGIALLAR